MSTGAAQSQAFWRERYITFCASRCLKHLQTIGPAIRAVLCCVAVSIALIEAGGRSTLEQTVERALFRSGLLFARAGLLPGGPDISVGPYQIRPSTAFGWRRRSVPGGHIACPPGGVGDFAALLCHDLLTVDRSALWFVDTLKAAMPSPVSCSDLVVVYARYRGDPLALRDVDSAVLVKIHRELHQWERPGAHAS